MIRGADLSHADICEISTELEAEENPDPYLPATFITTGAAGCGGSCPRPIDTRRRLSCHISGIGLAGTWVPNSGRGAGTARLRDLRCVAAVARQARMLRSPKLQCESGRPARDRPDLDYEPQQARGIPRNLRLDETGVVDDVHDPAG